MTPIELAEILQSEPGAVADAAAEELRRLHSEVMLLKRKLSEMEQAEQKPFAWMSIGGTIWRHKGRDDDVPLYSRPPRREWKGLTHIEKEVLWDHAVDRQEHYCSQYADFADSIESHLKERNT